MIICESVGEGVALFRQTGDACEDHAKRGLMLVNCDL